MLHSHQLDQLLLLVCQLRHQILCYTVVVVVVVVVVVYMILLALNKQLSYLSATISGTVATAAECMLVGVCMCIKVLRIYDVCIYVCMYVCMYFAI